MSKRWLFWFVPVLVALPSALYAAKMGGMGGMGGVGLIGEVIIQTKTVGEIVFSHNFHGTNCRECHPKVFKQKNNSNHVTMKVMEQGKSCGTCHNGKRAFTVKANCTRCHAGDIVFTDKNVGKLIFSHDVHIDMLGGCDSCHPAVFKPKKGADRITMKAMENGKFCGACHNGDEAFSVADSADCAKCHAGDILFRQAGVGDVTFPHSFHIEALGGCDSCHPDLFKAQKGANRTTMAAMENGASCGACHDGDQAFSVAQNCDSCHKGGIKVGKISIRTQNVGNVVFDHGKHGTKCDGCHSKIFKKKNNSNHVDMKAMEQGKSCGACHNGKKAFSVTGDCVKCHAGDILFKNEDAGDVTFPHSTHIEALGGCDSCHPDLFKAKRGADKMTMKDMENGQFCGACHDGSDAFSVKEDCESCHKM